jgi:CBS domain-containing protein
MSERSVCLRVLALRCDTPSWECIDPTPAVCRPGDDAFAALATIAQSQVRGAVAVNAENELLGVLSHSMLAIRVSTAAQELYAALKNLHDSKAHVSGT